MRIFGCGCVCVSFPLINMLFVVGEGLETNHRVIVSCCIELYCTAPCCTLSVYMMYSGRYRSGKSVFMHSFDPFLFRQITVVYSGPVG